jgi:hypothetical protein
MSTIQSATTVTNLAGDTVYQVTYSDGTVSFVPLNASNRDYAALQAWVAQGGVIGQSS